MFLRGVTKPLYLLIVGIISLGFSMLMGAAAHAVDFNLGITDGADSARGIDQVTDLFGQAGIFHTVTNVLLYLIGAISVIMLIVGGLRYVLSGGDSTRVQGARNTILYAIVGIIVAILAYAAISFVITSFSGDGGVTDI